MTEQDLQDRAKAFVDAEWAEFMQSLRDYPTYEAWLTGYELPKMAAIKARCDAYELQKSGTNAANMAPERRLDIPRVD